MQAAADIDDTVREMSAQLHDFWEIGLESFRALVRPRLDVHVREAFNERRLPVPMRGDALIDHPDDCLVRTTRIDAPPAAVWPWLAQVYRGGGVYGWIRLESPRCWSAHCLLADLPSPRPGDRMGDLLELAFVEEERGLVWRAPGPLLVESFPIDELTLEYRLAAASSARTDLVVRVRGRADHLTRQVIHYLFDVIDFALAGPQVVRLRGCVERAGAHGGRRCGLVRKIHQAAPFYPAGARRILMPSA